jgi:hypothetical protein
MHRSVNRLFKVPKEKASTAPLLAGATETAWATLDNLLLGNSNNVDGDGVEAHGLKEVLGLLVNVQGAVLAVLREVESGDLGDVLILALTLLFLELEGDATDGTALDTLHTAGY